MKSSSSDGVAMVTQYLSHNEYSNPKKKELIPSCTGKAADSLRFTPWRRAAKIIMIIITSRDTNEG